MSEIDLTLIEKIAIEAGREILDVYQQEDGMGITIKDDNSPLTIADQRAHHLIVKQLAEAYPDIPILSEESTEIPFETRQTWNRYWLVDPLDGTKEFISRNGEFTVNIALIDEGCPVAGVVHVPVQDVTYSGQQGQGASKTLNGQAPEAIRCEAMSESSGSVKVVASRNHRGEIVDQLIAEIERKVATAEVLSMGSSLKMCLIAEGKADIYPRLAPTSEWDTAAAHAVVIAAGGEIVDLNFDPLRYNQKESLLNPFFIALADTDFPWQALAKEVIAEH